jgi:hypothetical protein
VGLTAPRGPWQEGLWICGRSALPTGSASPASRANTQSGEMLAFAHIPAATKRLDIDEIEGRSIAPAIALTAIGAGTEIRRATPEDAAPAVSPLGSTSTFSNGRRAAGLPLTHKLTAGTLVAMHGVGKVELAVEFERPRLNRQGPRGGPGLCRLVKDAHHDPELGEPERQDQPSETGTNDQNLTVRHFVLYPLVRRRQQAA